VLALFDNDGDSDGSIVRVGGESCEPCVGRALSRACFSIDCDILFGQSAVYELFVGSSRMFIYDGVHSISDDGDGVGGEIEIKSVVAFFLSGFLVWVGLEYLWRYVSSVSSDGCH